MGTKTITALIAILTITAVFAVGYFIYSDKTQQTAITTQTQQITSGTSLNGKPATISVSAFDGANDKAQIGAKLYLVKNPVVTADAITGEFSADGTILSSSSRTDVTSGLVVGDSYVAVASNSSYFGFPTSVKKIDGTQAELLDLISYTQANNGQIQITVKDKDENTLSSNGAAATQNLTIGADEDHVLDTVKFEVNASNVATNLAGFYFDKATNGNITTVSKAGGYSGSPAFEKTTLNLERTEADDIVFLLSSPKVLLEWDSVEIRDGILIDPKDSDPKAAEILTLYTLDKIWVKSSKYSDKLIYAYETDASSPADVGMTDASFGIALA